MKFPRYFFIFISTTITAWGQQEKTYELPKSKRFIDKVEVFVGPNLSFNYGNKFIENYSDAVIQNRRLSKTGYSFGFGIYHPISAKIDLGVRLQLEQKGTRAELNRPFASGRQTIESEYSYSYTTLAIASRFTLDKKQRIAISFGGYVAKISSGKGQEIYSDPNGGPSVYNNFVGRNWNIVDPDGAIRNSTFIPGLKSFNDYDYGLILGLSYKIPFGLRHSVQLQLIDYYGLQNVYNNQYAQNLSEKNHTVSFLIGYILSRSLKK